MDLWRSTRPSRSGPDQHQTWGLQNQNHTGPSVLFSTEASFCCGLNSQSYETQQKYLRVLRGFSWRQPGGSMSFIWSVREELPHGLGCVQNEAEKSAAGRPSDDPVWEPRWSCWEHGLFIHTYVYMYIYVYIFVHIYVDICLYICTYMCIYMLHVCIYTYMYVCRFVCIYVYIYIRTNM